jgi:[ribosomal protein S5]-alanine N-acetyltransferase
MLNSPLSINIKDVFTPFPTLSTPNLILRALQESDLDDLYVYASDPEIDRFTPWTHYKSLDEARADLDDFMTEYEENGMGVWGIEHSLDRRLIGIISFSRPHPRHWRSEMGYTISRAYWGRGYATEAGQAVVRFGLDQLHLVRIEAVCLPDHYASARVLQKIGMHYEGILRNYQIWRGKPRDLLMYGLTGSRE